jgi:hypothetical protein
MKKALGFLSLMFITGLAHADLFDYVRDKAVAVHYSNSIAAAVTSTSAVLIDLSDTVNWPHKDNGAINISSIRVGFDKAAASTATVRIGVVNFVNTSTGSVTWFYKSSNDLNVSNTDVDQFDSYGEGFLRTKIVPVNVTSAGVYSDGKTPYIASNEITTGSTVYQTDVVLPSLLSTGSASGQGDIVIEITKGVVAVNLQIEIVYFSDKR